MILIPIKLIVDPVRLSMSDQHILIAQIPAHFGFIQVWGREPIVATITNPHGLVDGEPVLHTVGVEGEYHVCVVCEPVGYEGVGPATCKGEYEE